MPGNWDPQVYRARAQQWRAEAERMPPGDTRDAYLTISEGYAKLADLIERDGADHNIGPIRRLKDDAIIRESGEDRSP
jgi:hypothetical protein